MKHFYLAALLFTATMNAQVPTGAVAFWPMDGTGQDLSGNGNNGTVVNATPAPNRFGTPNKAYRFNGTTSKITVPHNSFVDVANGTDFSFSYWQKAYPGNVSKLIISKHTTGSWNGYNFVANNQIDPGYCMSQGHMHWYVASGAFQDACSNGPAVIDTTWRCIVGVYNATTNESFLYINGVQQTDIGGASGVTSNTSDLCIGWEDDLGTYFNGVLDNVRMFKRVLTPTEITQLCNEAECTAPAAPLNMTSLSASKICKNTSAVIKASGTGTVSWHSTATTSLSIGSGTVITTPTLGVGTHIFYAMATTCTNSPRTAITVTVLECTGIGQDISTADLYDVYPNPNTGNFTVRSDKTGDNEIIILNQLGVMVYRQKIYSHEMLIDTDLPTGIYFLHILDNEKSIASKKLVITR